MKKLINSPETEVKDALAGMALAHADLIAVHYDPDFIVRAGAPTKGKVGIISGGGSGHEPMHGGFVGKGIAQGSDGVGNVEEVGRVGVNAYPHQFFAFLSSIYFLFT